MNRFWKIILPKNATYVCFFFVMHFLTGATLKNTVIKNQMNSKKCALIKYFTSNIKNKIGQIKLFNFKY